MIDCNDNKEGQSNQGEAQTDRIRGPMNRTQHDDEDDRRKKRYSRRKTWHTGSRDTCLNRGVMLRFIHFYISAGTYLILSSVLILSLDLRLHGAFINLHIVTLHERVINVSFLGYRVFGLFTF